MILQTDERTIPDDRNNKGYFCESTLKDMYFIDTTTSTDRETIFLRSILARAQP
jgi:hypothetical protein